MPKVQSAVRVGNARTLHALEALVPCPVQSDLPAGEVTELLLRLLFEASCHAKVRSGHSGGHGRSSLAFDCLFAIVFLRA